MAVSEEFLHYVREQLAGLRGVTHRRMFGGAGLYCDGVIFGFIADDVLYFKAGPANRADYTARGMGAFRPFRDKPKVSVTYFELPPEVLEDPDECLIWARRCLGAAPDSR